MISVVSIMHDNYWMSVRYHNFIKRFFCKCMCFRVIRLQSECMRFWKKKSDVSLFISLLAH